MSDDLGTLIQRVTGQPAGVVDGMMRDAGLDQTDEKTPYERELRRAMVAVERIANDDGPREDRLQALARHRAFVTRLLETVKGE